MVSARVDLVVNADFQLDGTIRPKGFYWPDNGKYYGIDRVLDVRPAASLAAGGAGILYLCRCCGKEIKLFDEDGKWFMERRCD